MKTLRYKLLMLAVTGVLSVSAQTPQYGKPYRPRSLSYRAVQQQELQMPGIEMRSTGSGMMASGSMLPQAAMTGTMMADEMESVGDGVSKRAGRRRDPGVIEVPEDEDEQPIGDAVVPVMLLAMLFAGFVALRRRKAAR